MPGVGLDTLAILQQVDRGPLAALIEALPLREWNSLGILDVRHHLGRFGRDQRLKLAADVVSFGFEELQLRKVSAIVELDLGKLRIMEVCGLLVKVSGLARVIGNEALCPPL